MATLLMLWKDKMNISGNSSNLSVQTKLEPVTKDPISANDSIIESQTDKVTITSVPGVDYELNISGGGDKPEPR